MRLPYDISLSHHQLLFNCNFILLVRKYVNCFKNLQMINASIVIFRPQSYVFLQCPLQSKK